MFRQGIKGERRLSSNQLTLRIVGITEKPSNNYS